MNDEIESKFWRWYPFESICLSGGGLKVFGTLGALHYAHDMDLLKNIKHYSGTSAGAMVCYLLAIGYSPLDIISYICTNKVLDSMIFDAVSMTNNEGCFKYEHIQLSLERMTIRKIGQFVTMGQLLEITGNSLSVVTFNATTGKTEFFSSEDTPEVNCLDAIRMSSNIPIVFSNYTYNRSKYIDGAFGSNFPIDQTIGNSILGVNIINNNSNICIDDQSIPEYIYKLVNLMFSKRCGEAKVSEERKVKIINLDINWEVINFNITTPEILDIFSNGYRTAEISFKSVPEPEPQEPTQEEPTQEKDPSIFPAVNPDRVDP